MSIAARAYRDAARNDVRLEASLLRSSKENEASGPLFLAFFAYARRSVVERGVRLNVAPPCSNEQCESEDPSTPTLARGDRRAVRQGPYGHGARGHAPQYVQGRLPSAPLLARGRCGIERDSVRPQAQRWHRAQKKERLGALEPLRTGAHGGVARHDRDFEPLRHCSREQRPCPVPKAILPAGAYRCVEHDDVKLQASGGGLHQEAHGSGPEGNSGESACNGAACEEVSAQTPARVHHGSPHCQDACPTQAFLAHAGHGVTNDGINFHADCRHSPGQMQSVLPTHRPFASADRRAEDNDIRFGEAVTHAFQGLGDRPPKPGASVRAHCKGVHSQTRL
mmetsp:Transcript_83404/g.232601  ORF Transcript_83404/g.232601 Transcript_83404/m.232601 type:complete len:337 (+) Transcript_83404:478-1488(+)